MKPQGYGLDMHQTGIGALCAAVVFAAVAAPPASAQGWMPPPPEERCPSQWGANDELGAASLQTPQIVLRATRMIREGKVYELAKVLDRFIPKAGARSYSLNSARTSLPNGPGKRGTLGWRVPALASSRSAGVGFAIA